MNQPSNENHTDRSTRRRGAVSSAATHSAAILAAAAAFLMPVPRASAEGWWTASVLPPGDQIRQRTRRWWLDTWSHSMQEKLFVLWMNEETGGTEWQLTMTPAQVNALYAWWLQTVWPTL